MQKRALTSDSSAVFVFAPFRLDAAEQRLWRGEELVPIKPKTFAVLKYLIEHSPRLVDKEELLDRFWGDVHIGEGVLKTHIREIREALGEGARDSSFIQTVRTRGYRFVGPAQSQPSVPSACCEAPGAERAWLPSPCAPAVGRGGEIERLTRCWRKARGGDRQVVFITGELGIGKTALVNAFVREHLALESDATIAWGQCIDQYGSGEPYLPVIEALRRACRMGDGERVAGCLRRNAPAWCAHIPALLSSEAARAAGGSSPVPSPERMLGQMADALEALSQERALALLIEDLHWADHSTLDLLAYVAQRADPARLLIVATCRSPRAAVGRLADLEDALKVRNRCVTLPVPLLAQAAMREYLDQRLGAHRLPSSVPWLLHERTEGNALFMVGVVDGWLDRGLLAAVDGRYELTGSLDDLARCVPETCVRMIERDLERATSFERSVLEAAAVAGQVFSAEAVAAALQAQPEQIEDLATRWAQREQFFRKTDAAEWRDGTISQHFEFLHVLYRQVIYDQLSAARRAQWHRRVGQRLELGHGDQAELMGAELALHFREGRQYDRAVRYLRTNGERASARGAYREAREHLTRALELTAKLPESKDRAQTELQLLVLSAALSRITDGFAAPEVEQTYARAAQSCAALQAIKQLFPILAGMGAVYILRGSIRTAVEHGERFLGMAREHGDADALSEAHLVLGVSRHALGQHTEAMRHLDQVVAPRSLETHAAPLSLGGRQPTVAAQCFLAYSRCITGGLDQGLRGVEQALELARELADPFAMALALNFCGHVRHLRREPEAARGYADALEAHSDRYGLAMFAGLAMAQRGRLEIEHGNASLGLEQLQRSWAKLEAMGAKLYRPHFVSLVAQGYALVGQREGAMAVFDQVAGEPDAEAERVWDAELFRAQGELLANTANAARRRPAGDPEWSSAERCFMRALETARQQGARLFELRAALSLAKYWQASGAIGRAHALLSSVYASFAEGLDTPDLVEARGLLDSLSSASSQRAEALA